jgi:hypothetical protein
MRKLLILAGGVCAIFLTAFIATTVPVKQIGPWYTASTTFDSLLGGQVGGEVKTYLAADTLRIGQVVYLSANNTAAKSATLANYNSLLGVVVGGQRVTSQGSVSVADTSTIAAIASQRVLVQSRGRAWVLFDTGAGLAPGTQLVPSVKSGMGGRAATRTTIIDTFYRVLGRAVDTVVSGKAVLINLSIK